MRIRSSVAVVAVALALALCFPPQSASARTWEGFEVSRLHTIAHVAVGQEPIGLAVDIPTNRIYVCNLRGDTVSVISGATNTVIATIPVEGGPFAVALNETTALAYVANRDGTLAVIDTGTNQVVDTIAVGTQPSGVAVDIARNEIFVTNQLDDTVSVVDGTTDQVVDTVVVGDAPFGIVVDRPRHRVYVANHLSGSISALSSDTHEVVDTFPFGAYPEWLALDPSRGHLYVSGQRFLEAMDVRTGAEIAHYNALEILGGITVDPFQHRLLVAYRGADTVLNMLLDVDGTRFLVTGHLPRGVKQPTGIASNWRTRHDFITNPHDGVVTVVIHVR